MARSSSGGKRIPVRVGVVVAAAVVATLLAACGGVVDEDAAGPEGGGNGGNGAAAGYPERPIELIVPWAAGGGTDQVGRTLAQGLSDELGQQVNVVNRTGGGGVVGHSAMANAEPDGYTVGLVTVEIAMMHWMGLTEVGVDDLRGVAQVNFDPAGITVAADSGWNSFDDFMAQVRKNPGELRASGTGRGGIWDLARAGMLVEAGLEEKDIVWVPSEGAAPALQQLVAGGIDVSFASLPENQAMIAADRAVPLAVMAEERLPQYEDVPTLQEQGVDTVLGAWRGLAVPKDTPDAVVEKLERATRTVVEGDQYEKFMGKAGFGIQWRDASRFDTFMADEDKEFGDLMRQAGLAK